MHLRGSQNAAVNSLETATQKQFDKAAQHLEYVSKKPAHGGSLQPRLDINGKEIRA